VSNPFICYKNGITGFINNQRNKIQTALSSIQQTYFQKFIVTRCECDNRRDGLRQNLIPLKHGDTGRSKLFRA
jgi:hypothetical protein